MAISEGHNEENKEQINPSPKPVPWWRKILRAILFFFKSAVVSIVSFFFLLTLIATAIHLPYVQKGLTDYVTKSLTEFLKHPISVSYIYISWFDTIVIKGVRIESPDHDPLIRTRDLRLKFSVRDLLNTKLTVQEAWLSGATVDFIYDQENKNFKFNSFIDAIIKATEDTAYKGEPFHLGLDKVHVRNSKFIYSDPSQDTIRDMFDYLHMTYEDVNAEVSNLDIYGPITQMDVNSLSAKEIYSGLKLKDLKAHLFISPKRLALEGLKAKINNSYVSDSLAFRFDDYAQFSDFNNLITLDARLDSTIIYTEDLAVFAPYFKERKQYFSLKSKFSGKVADFKIKDFSIACLNNGSTLRGSLEMKGLPEWQTCLNEINVKTAKLSPADLAPYFPDSSAALVNRLGTTELTGFFKGTFFDFSLYADAATQQGSVSTNLKMNLNKKIPTYSGKIITQDLNLGSILSVNELKANSVNLDFDGEGFSLADLNIRLDGTGNHFGLIDYDYRNLKVKAKFTQKSFFGDLVVNDSNLYLALNGVIDLTKEKELVDFNAQVKKANLRKLKFHPDIDNLSFSLEADFHGLDPDKLSGYARAENLKLNLKGKPLSLKELYVSSVHTGEETLFEFDSDYADLMLRGNFSYNNLLSNLTFLYDDVLGYFGLEEGLELKKLDKRRQKVGTPSNEEINVLLSIKDLNPLITAYFPENRLSRNFRVDGSFSSNDKLSGRLKTNVDRIQWSGFDLINTSLDLSFSKGLFERTINAKLNIDGQEQVLPVVGKTSSLRFSADWENQNITSQFLLKQIVSNVKSRADTNSIVMNGELSLKSESYDISFQKSFLQLLGKKWELIPSNLITIFQNKRFEFSNLNFQNGNEKFGFNGRLEKSSSDSLEVLVTNFSLASLQSVIPVALKGILNADLLLKRPLETLNMTGDLLIDSLKVDKIEIGNLTVRSEWQNATKDISIEGELQRNSEKVLLLSGIIDPDAQQNNYNITASVNKLGLTTLEPFLKGIFSNWSGSASGDLKISGKFQNPQINGKLAVSKGVFRFDYLNTTYRFEDVVAFSNNKISVENANLFDINNNKAFIKKAAILHKGFTEFGLDMEASLDKFQVMNTNSSNGEMYYGEVYASGSLNLNGPFENLSIQSKLKSEKGTKVNIPVKTTGSETQKSEFIRFTNSKVKDIELKDSTSKQLAIQGLTMNFNLLVTPDAEIEIVFNERTGEVIKGVGSGNLKLAIDTRGEFTMVGNYVMEKGSYNFIFLNTVNKKFDLQKGSNITWSGAALAGLLDIKASHKLNASLRPLINITDTVFLERPEVRRKYPIEILMDITGDLLKPQIAFKINISKDYPAILTPYITPFEARLANDEQELNRQVFSLFLIRSFLPSGQLGGGEDNFFATGGSATITEMLSNQLSSLISTLDENIEVDIDVNGMDRAAINALQLRLSYTLMEGRLRIARSGGFTNAQNQTTASSIAGDWTVDYLLTKEGSLRMRMFIRNNQNQAIQGLNNLNQTSSGFTLLWTKSFDHLKDLFKKKQPVNYGFQEDLMPRKEEEEEKPKDDK